MNTPSHGDTHAIVRVGQAEAEAAAAEQPNAPKRLVAEYDNR